MVFYSLLSLSSCGSEVGLRPGDRGTDPGASSPGACELPTVEPGLVPIDEACTRRCDMAHDAWDVVIEWEASPITSQPTGFSQPLAVDPGDGGSWILQRTAGVGGELFSVWDGDGAEVTQLDGPFHDYFYLPAVADLDGDGVAEVLTVTGSYEGSQVTARRITGEILWVSETFRLAHEDQVYIGACTPVVADLEGDGSVEVFCDRILLEGATGQTRVLIDADPSNWWLSTTVVDLDLDGVREIVVGRRVLDASGQLRWQAPQPQGLATYPAVVQLDADPEAEVVFAADGRLLAFEHDGQQIWQTDPVTSSQGAGSPPCTGDLDGDGGMEIAVAMAEWMVAFELDGRELWRVPIEDPSTAASCFSFDFDADGRDELAYADEERLSLFCGGDGALLFSDPTHRSGTYVEHPLVVDVDADGSAEVVVGRSGFLGVDETAGVAVYGQRDGAWASAGVAWPQQDYRLTNQSDGGVWVDHTPTWLDHNRVRSRPPAEPVPPFEPPELIDVGIEVVGLCADACAVDGIDLLVRAWNSGTADLLEPVRLGIYAVSSMQLGHAQERWVHSVEVPALRAGTSSAGIEIHLPAEDLGAFGIALRLEQGDPSPPSCAMSPAEILLPLPCQEP